MVTEQIREDGQRENPYAIQRKPRIKSRSQSEFNLTVRAKNGDPSANLELWERYKPVTISILGGDPESMMDRGTRNDNEDKR